MNEYIYIYKLKDIDSTIMTVFSFSGRQKTKDES